MRERVFNWLMIALVGSIAHDATARRPIEIRVTRAACGADAGSAVPSSAFDLRSKQQATIYFLLAEGVGALARNDTSGLAEAIGRFQAPLKEQIISAGFMAVDVRLAGRRRGEALLGLRIRRLTWDEFRAERARTAIPPDDHVQAIALNGSFTHDAAKGMPAICVAAKAASRAKVPPDGGTTATK